MNMLVTRFHERIGLTLIFIKNQKQFKLTCYEIVNCKRLHELVVKSNLGLSVMRHRLAPFKKICF